MSLHNGIDTVAIATLGIYSKTYGSGAAATLANLFASFGFLEDAPDYTPSPSTTSNLVWGLIRNLVSDAVKSILGS